MSFTDSEALLIMQNGQDRAYAAREINKANEEIRRLRRELAKTKGALAVEVAHSTGCAHMVREIKEKHPELAVFRPTGKTMPDGRPQVALHLVYEREFDRKAAELGISEPHNSREVAK